MRATRLVTAVTVGLSLCGCNYSYRNPAEALRPGEVSGRTVAGAEVLLDGVAISVKGASLDGSSRSSGHFSMLPLPAGRHTLVFRKGGERVLQREVEIGYGSDGQPEGIWMGDVTVPASVALHGECNIPGGTSLADNGIAVDDVSGEIVPINGGSFGDFTFTGLSVGEHRIRVFVSDVAGVPYVGGPVAVTFTAADAATQKTMSRFALHPASALPGDTGSVTLRFRVAGAVPGLSPGDVTVYGLPTPFSFQSNGFAQVDVPEGLWTVQAALPARLTGVSPPPLVTFVAVRGETIDLGTLYAVSDLAQSQAAVGCSTDADCAPGGVCQATGFCTQWSPPSQPPAGVAACDVDTSGCPAGQPYLGVWNGGSGSYDPPYTMTCVAWAEIPTGSATVAVACGGCCTPDGVGVVCGEPGVGGCPSFGPMTLTPSTAGSDGGCFASSDVTFTVSGGTPPYTWSRDVGGLTFSTDTTQGRWSPCDYSIGNGTYGVTVKDSSLPQQVRSASITVFIP